MDQSRGSAASSNSLSAPLHFLCWTGRCESRLERCSQCTAIRTQTLDQAGTGDQSSIDSSISNREKTESRRGQLSSKGVAGRRLGALAGNETKASHWSTRPSAKFQLYPTAPSPIPGCFSLTKAYFVSRDGRLPLSSGKKAVFPSGSSLTLDEKEMLKKASNHRLLLLE
ncbi:hypothetical protein L1887_58881 [Cichorium endivia]|nr:hypothetical protein L1887_58881 [Cichorium endivia]